MVIQMRKSVALTLVLAIASAQSLVTAQKRQKTQKLTEEQRIGKELTAEGSTPIERLDFALMTKPAEKGIDPETGKEIWRKEGVAPSGARGMNYWESPDRSDRRFIYLQRGDVIAVNARDGELVTSFGNNGRVDLRA